MKIKIAIDGPCGAGKSTIARQIAKRLNLIYVDTGAMYRAAALYAISKGVDIKNEPNKVVALLDQISIDLKYENNIQKIFLNDQDVTDKIREQQVTIGSSDIGLIKEVREKLVELQREIADKNGAVMDGRDIGTHVLTDANVKIFLTADVFERAQRRYKEFLEKGKTDLTFEQVLKDIEYRDYNDSNREIHPLKQADDATKMDTTGLSFEDSVELIYRTILEKLEIRGL